MKNQPRRSRLRGFTLVELLVVIGIIAVLISLLLPALVSGKKKVYIADTQNEISNLTAAIGQYEAVFNAYPGPFSNDQVDRPSGIPSLAVGITAPEIYIPSSNTYASTPPTPMPTGHWVVSGAENLAVGLLGGLRIDPKTGNLAYAPGDVGAGPMSLNPLNPKRFASFIQMTSGSTNITYVKTAEDSTGAVGDVVSVAGSPTKQFVADGNGGRFFDGVNVANDSPLPKFIDRFPTPMPILYLRARTGASGVISFVSSTNVVPSAQYDVGEIISYTGPNPNNNNNYIGAVNSEQKTTAMTTFAQGLSGIGPVSSMSTAPPYLPFQLLDPGYSGNPNNAGANAAAYFINASVPPADPSNPYMSAKPRSVDEYILISAGPDGIYGTGDDITSFGTVMQ